MAEYATPAVEVVKLVGSTVWKYVKFQITPYSYVTECGRGKEKLQVRCNDIAIKLQSQLMGIGKIPMQEVEDWLKRARNATPECDEDQFNRGGCFCNICKAKHFYERTKEMRVIHDEGEKYIHDGMILVHDDHTAIKDHLMREFQKTYVSLQFQKKDIDSTLCEQLHFGKTVKEEVKGWMEDAKKKLESAQVEVSQSGSLSPSFLANLLEAKVREMKELLVNGEKYTVARAILVKNDPSTARGLPFQDEKCYGGDTALMEILKYLKGDQVKRIAVWGMGGVGKTTLMKQIHNQFLREADFDKVIWVTVSSKLDILQIQNAIAKQLDGKELEEEDATARARKMLALLRRGNYLLLLDDVWEAFSDEDVGIPIETGGSKLVVTTRAADVARQIDCDELIKLQPLSLEESLQLFLDKVGKAVLSDDGNIKPRLKAALMEIVKECDGLPLAIVTVASTMKRFSDHQHSWLKALKQLRKGESVVGGEKDPIKILKFSYDYLIDEKVQHCFLYCALFPEDFGIPKDELIEYWIEEGFIDQMDTRHEMICEGHVILRKLEDSCLLESISESEVKIHDLLRDMVLDITNKSPRFFVKAGVSKEELRKEEAWPADVEKVSLMENTYRMQGIPLTTTYLKYNMLTTLLMPSNTIVMIPESFFRHTPSLRILDLSWNIGLEGLPDSISDLGNLTTLLLQYCYSLKKVPSLSKCRALTKLNLAKSGIEETPEGMEMLVNLKYLNLQGTRIKLLPEGMLLKLSNLEHLLVELTGIRVEDVVTLRKLEYLEAGEIIFERIEKMSILLGYIQEQMERLTSYTLQVEAPLLKVLLWGFHIDAYLLLNDKQIFHISYIDARGEDHDWHILANQSLSLQFLNIQSSRNLKRDSVFVRGFNPLQSLEELTLVDLPNLKYVFDEKALGLLAPPSSSHHFFPLKSIVIRQCAILKMLFSPALLRGYLQNLEKISISYCAELEEIISFTSEEEAPRIEEKLTLPKLKTLELNDLPKLKSICGSSSVLVCDSLEVLEIRRCRNLNRVPLCFPQHCVLKKSK